MARHRSRDFEAAHLPVATFTESDAAATREVLDRYGLEISALAYYENNLHHDTDHRAAVKEHLFHAVDAAAMLGVPSVGTFVGRDNTLSVRDNMALGDRVLPELVEYAGERGVRLIVENCVMEGWHPDGYPGNLAYSPELWHWVTGLGFGLNWDPSHLTWIGIDPVETILPFAEHIVHAQAKDVELFPRKRDQYGFFGKVDKGDDPWDMGWWRFPRPGPRGRGLAARGRPTVRGGVHRHAERRARGPAVGRHRRQGARGPPDRAPHPAPPDRTGVLSASASFARRNVGGFSQRHLAARNRPRCVSRVPES